MSGIQTIAIPLRQTERTLPPGAVAQTRVAIVNDGPAPARFVLQLLVEGSPDSIAEQLTPILASGQSASIRVPLGISQRATAGGKDVTVILGEVNPLGQLVRVLDRQTFSGRLRIGPVQPPAPPVFTPLPPTAPTPAPRTTPAPPTALTPGQFQISGVRSTPTIVQQGQRFTVTFLTTNPNPTSQTVVAQVIIQGPGGFEAAFRRETVTLPPGNTPLNVEFLVDAKYLRLGPYSALVSIHRQGDLTTILGRATAIGVVTVAATAAPTTSPTLTPSPTPQTTTTAPTTGSRTLSPTRAQELIEEADRLARAEGFEPQSIALGVRSSEILQELVAKELSGSLVAQQSGRLGRLSRN